MRMHAPHALSHRALAETLLHFKGVSHDLGFAAAARVNASVPSDELAILLPDRSAWVRLWLRESAISRADAPSASMPQPTRMRVSRT